MSSSSAPLRHSLCCRRLLLRPANPSRRLPLHTTTTSTTTTTLQRVVSLQRPISTHPKFVEATIRTRPLPVAGTGRAPAVYSRDELRAVAESHRPAITGRDRIAYGLAVVMRAVFDFLTRYSWRIGKMTERQWLTRIVYLETVAAVPAFAAAMIRHMRSLRSLDTDKDLHIHQLLEEAENERMHLMTFSTLRQPGPIMSEMVLITQGVLFNTFFFSYLLSPSVCHRFVAYLEESAIKTYTHCLADIDGGGKIAHWATAPAPDVAIAYWNLRSDATLRDVVEVVRADETGHRDRNHDLSDDAKK
ncbi:alternative oxidase [Zopfochytrium polystomum]|nr:alternative oxidase [Zopfochytrium polystomum]